ncbi:MAG: DNA-protecting protein DprA [Thiotrichaceae bacterium]|nr:DNA-protecting protein DprA [Thiotrichaceae bacterium]PCI12506.1 MAG: DNA-protecting protein DprA [Thiotrichales bacterium]
MKPEKGISVSEDDLAYWLALLLTPGIGTRRFQALLSHMGSPREIFNTSTQQLIDTKAIPKNIVPRLSTPNWPLVEKQLHWQQQPGHHIITCTDLAYPALLKDIIDPPPLLFIQGNTEILSRQQIAIVGSRNPSHDGSENTFAFARDLTRHGYAITSGLALGVDTAAHNGALASNGTTIAVMGTGPDHRYPNSNRILAEKILQNGALVTEFPLGTPPLAENFPRRNRIISGMSLGVLVTEAALRSGSLITARSALEQGREVFAIPGSIHNPLARGCHSLLRDGAKLVENTQDIIEELGALSSIMPTLEQPLTLPLFSKPLDPNEQKVLSRLGFDPSSIDTLVARTELTAEELSAILLVLELHNYVKTTPGGHYVRNGMNTGN